MVLPSSKVNLVGHLPDREKLHVLRKNPYKGQCYYSSHYFHVEYLRNSEVGRAKYQRHDHFIRVVKGIPAYREYVANEDIVEFTSWKHAKSTSPELGEVNETNGLYSLFRAVKFRAVYLL